MKKKQNNIRVSFVDEPAAMDVTGSMVYVKTDTHNILIDAGLHQSNSKYDDFLVNKRRFKEFKPKDIDYIFISHLHADHVFLSPRLYKEGCSAKMIVAQDNYRIMHRMAEDSAYIIERDIELINNQHGKNYDPLYTIEDVERTMNYVSEYPVMEKIVVDDTLSFMLIPNGHLLGSVQILLYLKQNNIEKTLLFTGDIGNSKVHNYYVNKFTPVDHADLVIGESTYGDRPDLKTGQKERNNDIEKLFSIITQQVCEMHGHTLRGTDSAIQNMESIYNEDIDFLLVGHYHGMLEKSLSEGITCDKEILVCPSFVGSDPYADSIFKGSKSACKLFEFTEREWHTASFKIQLN